MSSQNIAPSIRLFRPEDKPSVLWILQSGVASQAALAAELRLRTDTGYVDWGGAKSINAMRHRRDDCYVAEIGDRIVGFMRVRVLAVTKGELSLEDGREPEQYLAVEEINVAADMRGKGIGASLLTESEEIARARGCIVIGVLYLANNEGSARLNKRCGFTLPISKVMKCVLSSERVSVRRFKIVG